LDGLQKLRFINKFNEESIFNKFNEESKLNVQQLDMKNNCQSPAKMIVVSTNSTVGLPTFPPPFHLCGNVSSIPNMQLGQQDLCPTFLMISPTVLFKDVFSVDNRQAIIDLLDKKV
jgi:hypothetical protein